MHGTKDNLTTVNKSFLPTPDDLQEWHTLKDREGPTFAGSPPWKSYLSFLEKGFKQCGLTNIQKDFITYKRWFTSHERSKGDWTLAIEGEDVRVASY